MPVGAAFNVHVAEPHWPTAFVHVADASTIVGNSSYLDNGLTNHNPSIRLLATQNWQPGGVYNDQAIGVWYDTSRDMWAVFNQDGANMPEGAAFNVIVMGYQVFMPIVVKN
jgi:hypothetical protein